MAKTSSNRHEEPSATSARRSNRSSSVHWSLAGYVWKVKRALQYIDEFEQAAAREAARRGMAGVVCGHIHRPAVRSIGSVLYCNTGDWVESCTALVEREDGSLALLSFADRAPRSERAPVRAQPPGGA